MRLQNKVQLPPVRKEPEGDLEQNKYARGQEKRDKKKENAFLP
jgi:hypothetical protein